MNDNKVNCAHVREGPLGEQRWMASFGAHHRHFLRSQPFGTGHFCALRRYFSLMCIKAHCARNALHRHKNSLVATTRHMLTGPSPMLHDTHDEDYQPVERLNKSQQKREIQALLELGKKLSGLGEARLIKMNLPVELLQALIDSKSMKHGALKRQFKFITKCLRQINTESLENTVTELELKKAEQDRGFHRVEHWRDRLIEEGQIAITEFMAKYPQADVGQIRQLIRNANKELLAKKPPKSSRALFRLLRDMIAE